MKDRTLTENTIMKTVENIIAREGFQKIGINKIAREAGVSKILIYRYFGDLNNLLRQSILSGNYWVKSLEAIKTGNGQAYLEPAEVLIVFFRQIRENKFFKEVIRWQISTKDPLATEIMNDVEQAGTEFLAKFSEQIKTDFDLEALSALVISGIYYLCLLQDIVPAMSGIKLQNEGWVRIEKTLLLMIQTARK